MSDRNTSRKVVEDTPEMRSVALHSASPMPLARATPLLQTKTAAATTTTEPQLRSTSVGSKNSCSSEQREKLVAVWGVTVAPELPPMYFLERTHVYVPNATVKQVAARIVECLRHESIATKYHSDEAMVEAETPDHVQFAVRLWNDQDQVVVEVQRAEGCCFLFHQASKAVLRAAKGLKQAPPPPAFNLPKCVPQPTEEERKNCLQEGLDIAISLLKQNSVDAHIMALESLLHLTKVCKCHGYAADCILNNSDILHTILSLILNSSFSEESQSTTMNSFEDSRTALMRRDALTILANCLCSLQQHGKLQQNLYKLHEDLLSDNLTLCLIDQVSSADEEPHEACQAVHCLQCLMEGSVSTRRRAMELGVDAAVSSAYEEGQRRHAQLEECCDQLRLSMSTSSQRMY